MSTIVRLTLDEYDRMIERAVFERDRRIELIHGELREMSPIGDPHRDAVNVLTNDWVMVQNTAPFRALGNRSGSKSNSPSRSGKCSHPRHVVDRKKDRGRRFRRRGQSLPRD